MKPPPVLGTPELVAAAGALVAAGALAAGMGLGLSRTIATAAARMVVQLMLVGLVLRWVFGLASPGASALILGFMTLNAGRAAVGRVSRRVDGLYPLAVTTLTASAVLVAVMGCYGVLGAEPWWRPRVLIPVTGMLLGNALNGIALVFDRSLEAFAEDRGAVEARLALGATPDEAAAPVVREAVRTGALPILNSMAICGLVSLPGMMTGQILGGVDPTQAVRYQVVIMFLIAAATLGGGALTARGVVRRVFDDAGRLRSERVTPADS